MTTLTQKTKSGLSWSALESIANQGLSFVIQVVLARLIAPSEFGLLALLAIFIAFSQTIIDGGFTQAIIQKKSISRTDTSTVFYVNLLLSVLMYGVIFFAAPVISGYFEEPRLTLLVRVLGLNLIVNAVGKMQHSLLIRGLEFRKLFKIRTPAIVIGGLVGIGMAVQGYEVWALVWSQITTALFASICFWYFSERDMSPNWDFSFASLTNLGRFGVGILGASLFNQLGQNMYGLVIGKAFSFDQLGFYNRARTFHRTPASGMTNILNRVLFPVFSTIQDDDVRIRKALRKGIPIIAFVLFPSMAFLMCAADSIVVVLLTEKWLPSAGYMRWFPIIGMIFPIAAVQLSVVRAKGRSGLFFLMDVAKIMVSIGVLFFTCQHGVLAVVIGQVGVAIVANLLINLPVCHVVIGYQIKDQISDFLPYLICVAIAAVPAISVEYWAGTDSHWIRLILKGVIFSATYLALCYFTGLRAIGELSTKARFLLQRFSKTNLLVQSPIDEFQRRRELMSETKVDFLEENIVRRGEGWIEVNFDSKPVQSPLVSVSVTTYQHADYIAQTLDSIIAQEADFQFEILLGEDNSNDETRAICLEYARKFPELIRLILHDRTRVIEINGRPTGRFNWMTNLASARGTYIALCEGDDFWNDDSKLQKQVDFLEAHENYSLSFHDCSTVNSAGEIIDELLLGSQGRDLSQTDLIRGRRVPTLTAMFRREDLQNLPPVFLDVLNADTFIFAFLGQKGPGKFQSEIQPAAYRIHSGGIWSSATVMKKTDDLIGTFQAIVASTDPAFQSAARSELKSKYAMKLLACVRYRQPKEMIATCRDCLANLGWASLPGVMLRSLSQSFARIGQRVSKKKLSAT